MSVSWASRFAVLKLEDDDIESSIKKSCASNQSSKNKNAKPTGNETKSKPKKKKKNSNDTAELQNLAFGNSSVKPKQKSAGPVKLVQPNLKQWEEWKQKDSEFVSETYEHDLQQAILLSKIDFEEKKDIYEALSKENELNKQGSNKKKKKNSQKKEGKMMSLNKFQQSSDDPTSSQSQKENKISTNESLAVLSDTEFFNRIEEDAELIISKENRQDQYRLINPSEESARLRQYQEELRKKDDEITLLTETIKTLKDELKSVKSRNKKLYGILESGEMREKAEVLVEVDHLIAVRDELTHELSEYHTALEQERSKVHSLQMELKKSQTTKKQRTESK